MTPCVFMDKLTVEDGIGGTRNTYQEGAEFLAAIVIDSTTEARLAESANAKSIYKVTTKSTVNIPFDTVFKRVSDGRVFRATSSNRDKVTPVSATFHIAQCSAETWELTI